ncbi:hypothetical protein BJ508DRAFT_341114 [Ascobolus immersus RN42]|uniref:Uncharacterized protein n=1 Tax=Ascobolus immersus RN42 TaxID=1160509 RepID=A0A3N4ID88_ASCIM|nr:hypothetical protein BJ508DRAFT_341114 [Ascobolus immersus RN42]
MPSKQKSKKKGSKKATSSSVNISPAVTPTPPSASQTISVSTSASTKAKSPLFSSASISPAVNPTAPPALKTNSVDTSSSTKAKVTPAPSQKQVDVAAAIQARIQQLEAQKNPNKPRESKASEQTRIRRLEDKRRTLLTRYHVLMERCKDGYEEMQRVCTARGLSLPEGQPDPAPTFEAITAENLADQEEAIVWAELDFEKFGRSQRFSEMWAEALMQEGPEIEKRKKDAIEWAEKVGCDLEVDKLPPTLERYARMHRKWRRNV